MIPMHYKPILVVAMATMLAGALGCESDEDKVSLPKESAESKPSAPGDKPGEPAQADESEQSVGTTDGVPAKVAPALKGRRFSGSFEPWKTSRVAANVGGIVRKVYVEEGESVEEGDRLVDIDTQDYRLRVRQADAQLAAAQAQAETLETEYNRIEQLLAEDAVAQSEADQLSGNLAAARANVAQAKVGMRMARKAFSDAMIRAPFDGVVTMVSVEEGNFAAPGPQPLVEITQVGRLKLRAQIPEEYSSSIAEGDTLVVEVPAVSETLEVPVTRINPVIMDASRSFDVLAEVDNEELDVRPGMFAKVTLGESADDTSGGEQ